MKKNISQLKMIFVLTFIVVFAFALQSFSFSFKSIFKGSDKKSSTIKRKSYIKRENNVKKTEPANYPGKNEGIKLYSFEKQKSRKMKLKVKKAVKYLKTGNKYFNKDNFKTALKYYKKALKYNWNNPKIHNNIGVTLYYLNNYKDAETAFNNTLQLNKNDVDALQYLGMTLFKSGKTKEAIRAYSKVLNINPTNATAKKNITMLKNALAEKGESFNMTEPQEQPESSGIEQYGIGKLPLDIEGLPNSTNTNKDKMNKKLSIMYQRKGEEYFRNRNYDAALQQYLKAIENNPDNYTGIFNLGVVYYYLRDYNKSKETFEQLLFKKVDADVLVYLGLIQYKFGNNDRAIDYFNRALSINPNHIKAQKYKNSLLRKQQNSYQFQY